MHEFNLQREIAILKELIVDIEFIETYIKDLNDDTFLRDSKTKDAVLTRLMVIGEYGSRVDDSVKNRFKEIEWQQIKQARNYYAHVYRGIDWILVWNVTQRDIPNLKIQIEHIIEVLENENNAKIN